MAPNLDIKGDTFTSTTHHAPYPAIEPKPGSLPSPFNVCVIGASRDIGAHIVYSFAKAGATSIAVCAPLAEIETSSIPSKLQEINASTRLVFLPCDVTVSLEVEAFASKVRGELGHIDVLVYNAGYYGPWETRSISTPHDFSTAFDVNCKGLYLAVQSMLPLLKKNPRGTNGAIVAICSDGMHATGGPQTNTAYGISKLAQCRYIEMLAAIEPNVFSAAVHPGTVKTQMGRVAPKELFDMLPDDPYLCGNFIVWLTRERRMWLSGRYLSSNWDVDELASKEAQIVDQDKLKMRMVW